VKIVAKAGPDGIISPSDVHILDDHGKEMRNVQKVSFKADVDGSFGRVTLEVIPDEIEIECTRGVYKRKTQTKEKNS